MTICDDDIPGMISLQWFRFERVWLWRFGLSWRELPGGGRSRGCDQFISLHFFIGQMGRYKQSAEDGSDLFYHDTSTVLRFLSCS